MTPTQALGAAITILGLLLFAYAFTVGTSKGYIGINPKDKNQLYTWTSDAAAVIVGWFLLMIGPALWFGKTPSSIARRVEQARR